MRWIDRGAEPDEVAGYARQFTNGWIAWQRSRTGSRPADSYWSEFRFELGSRSNGNCWYCERRCEPASSPSRFRESVDHFQPLHRFPELAYEWSNWIFSCQRCNGDYKQDKWPSTGYVNPSAARAAERPEQYFDYDILSGNVIPRPGLSDDDRQKALKTIDDLGLNERVFLLHRWDYTREVISNLQKFSMADRQAFIDFYTSQPIEYAGIIGMVVAQMKPAGEA